MKTAVSMSDELFERGEAFRRRTGRSRSDLYSRALSAYLAQHEPDEITAAMDRVMSVLEGEPIDPFVLEAGRRVLERTEW